MAERLTDQEADAIQDIMSEAHRQYLKYGDPADLADYYKFAKMYEDGRGTE